MKLLHICLFYRNAMFKNLIKEQLSNNIDLRVFFYETRKRGLKNISEPYVDSQPSKVWYLPSPLLRIKRLKIVYKLMKNRYNFNNQFTLIHAHTLCQDGYLAWRVYKEFNIPYCLTIRACDLSKDNLWTFISRKNLYIEILRNANAISFLSKSAKNELFNLLNDSNLIDDLEKKSLIIPNGVDDFWHIHSCNNFRSIQSTEPLRILTVGRIEPNKNQLLVANSLPTLEREICRSVEYYIVGKATSEEYLKKVTSVHGVCQIQYCNKEELIDYYRKADIYVLTSIRESFGLSYVEAMTQGLPVVYSKGQGFDGQYIDGVVGFSANSESEESVVKAIKQCIENYDEISARCIDESKNYRWKFVADNYQRLYQMKG